MKTRTLALRDDLSGQNRIFQQALTVFNLMNPSVGVDKSNYTIAEPIGKNSVGPPPGD
jgi:hypothetical protein